MANEKVSRLDPATALIGDELMYVVQDGKSRQTSVAQVAAVYPFEWDGSDLSSLMTLRDLTTKSVDSATDLAGFRTATTNSMPTTSTLGSLAHGYSTGDRVSTTIAKNGILTSTLYHVIRVNADTISLAKSAALAAAGTAIVFDGIDTTVSGDVFTAVAHGLVEDEPVRVFSNVNGLTSGTTYYALVLTADTFSVSATPGGAAFTLTGTTAVPWFRLEMVINEVHALRTGDVVTPTTTVDGLTAGTPYYVIRASSTTLRFSASYADAIAGTYIDLTGTTNFTFRLLTDPGEGVFAVPDGLSADGSQGAWRRQYTKLDPAWFGAAGDDVTDDMLALQRCMIAANKLQIPVDLKGRKYRTIDSPADDDWGICVDDVQYVRLYGQGAVITSEFVGGRAFILRNGENVIVDGVEFRSAVSHVAYGIELHNISHHVVRQCKFVDNYFGLGVYEDTGPQPRQPAIPIDDSLIEDNYFEGAVWGCANFPKGTTRSDRQIIRRNTFIECETACKPFQEYVYAEYTDNSHLRCGVGTYAIGIGDYDVAYFLRNTFTDSTHQSVAINITDDHPTLHVTDSSNALLVVKNNIFAYSNGVTAPNNISSVFIAAFSVTNYNAAFGKIVIEDNEFERPHFAIQVSNVVDLERLEIRKNVVRDAESIELYFVSNTATTNNPLVEGNEFIWTKSTTKTVYSVRLSGIDGLDYIGNTHVNYGQYAVTDTAAATGVLNFTDNRFILGGSGVTGAPIQAVVNSAAITYNLQRNFMWSSDATQTALMAGSFAAPTVNAQENHCPKLTTTATPTVNQIRPVMLGNWTTNVDAAVNGYINVQVDKSGTIKKVATIA